MIFKLGVILATVAGSTLAAVCPGSSSTEEGDPFSVYPASKAVWPAAAKYEMAGNRIDCANICKHDTTCFGFEHSKGNCRIFDQTPIGLKWGSVDVGIPHYACKDGWYLNNWSQGFKGGQCCDVWMN